MEMDEARTRPPDTSVDGDPLRRRLRQETSPPAKVVTFFEAFGRNEQGFVYTEALQNSSPQLVGLSQASRRYDLDHHVWISSHSNSSSQKRKADMGDPMGVDAEMTEAIASNVERALATDQIDRIIPILQVDRLIPILRSQHTRQKICP